VTINLVVVYKFLNRGSGREGADLLSLVTSKRTQAKGMKLCQGKFILDIRNRFFTERVAGQWNWIPKEVVMAPSLSEFREHSDNALTHIVQF